MAHHQVTKSSQNTKIMNLAMHQPYQDQFVLLPNFSHLTLEVFVRIEYSQFSKTMIFVFHPTHPQVTKSSQNTKIMDFAIHQPCQDQFLLLPNFSHNTLEAFLIFQPFFQNHDFRFSPPTPPSHKIKPKHQNHRDWLCTSHAKINFFGSQTFTTSLWRHL